MDDLTALNRARDLISDPARWTQGTFARNAEGESVPPNSKNATCWCAFGALRKVTRRVGHWTMPLPGYALEINDEGTHAEVMAVFDAAIARESAQ